MASSLYSIVIDAHDLRSQARFWCDVLDWRVLYADDLEVTIGADVTATPGLTFVPVKEGKAIKNRLHIDLNPDDRDAEVERILALGARRADVGQGPDVTWVVLEDPEGNEFCVLAPKTSLTG
ncbi:VOC family protein [Streptomyces albireticuli]|uniref:Glyoxalase n=1 Tax=Streptomyces albireticuli TaxID=1940 RepID=A0A2A2D357_9ACTN|nr:VOC family protein [Streptomyces albireticuli]MCD9142299.1 VOC family protein [Streptomyces albireticuli]MCD9162447.1 VOC family protein [Streptomyces albireticuli]MCD9190473.1 VOC family protein [Streptomyces albireticuli]PAU45839.1 glyoxalase [Streptomyces albireticuli]